MYYQEFDIKELFELLNINVNYILAKNIANELPDKLKVGKDIDIIVHPDDYAKYRTLMPKHEYKLIIHPKGSYVGWKYLYGMSAACMYEHKEIICK